MFLNFIMEAEGAWPYRGSTESLDNDLNINSDKIKNSEYIYIQKDNQLFKFVVMTKHLDITNVFEIYLNNSSLDKFETLSKKEIKNKFPLALVRNVGKYYLAPQENCLTEILNTKYKENKPFIYFTSRDLHKLNLIKEDYKLDEKDFEVELIEKLVSSFEVELKDVYDINAKELETYIENIEKLIGRSECESVLKELSWILVSGSHNQTYINGLGIEDKFEKAINKNSNKKIK